MKHKYKAVFISDIHLGMKFINAESLLTFLHSFECEELYLVGDIIDGWNFSKNKWTKTQTKIVKNIIERIRSGTKVFYVPGNHDEFMRKYAGQYSNFIIEDELIYKSISGKRFLVVHGDLFDVVMIKAKWLAFIGDFLYYMLFSFNKLLNFFRWVFGKEYWSLAQYGKEKIKNVVSFIGKFENLLIDHANSFDCDGVICGHIHHAVIKDIQGKIYMNCGDWVESCTAIVEDYEGNFRMIKENTNGKI
jgi:UDP-2,3-diacylglucosamine pyrophosphatase LpxH